MTHAENTAARAASNIARELAQLPPSDRADVIQQARRMAASRDQPEAVILPVPEESRAALSSVVQSALATPVRSRCTACGHDPHAPGKCRSTWCDRRFGNCEGAK